MSLTAQDLKILARLFDEAWDLPETQREAWMVRLPTQYDYLKPTLSEWCARKASVTSDQFLNELPAMRLADASATHGGMPGASALSLEAGKTIGSYRLLREIGQGGMSTVWLASRVDGQLKRQVALKLPYVHLHLPQLGQRFARERDILADLAHPNIARLYDAGISEAGQPFLAMEFVDGAPLVEHCNHARLGVGQRLRLFLQVLAAVSYAHSRLVLHRDLKPSNILVTATHQVLLLDFGIAKLIANEADAERKPEELTALGARALTPAYASPEQIAGLPLSTASDVYSLGVVLYELLTGERPYRLKRNSSGLLEEAILNADAPHLSAGLHASQAQHTTTAAAKLAKELRGDLDAIVQKALKKSPNERYASADQLAQDLEAYLAGNPVTAQPDSRAYLLKRFLGRHKGAVAAVSGILLAIIAGACAALYSAHVADVERDHALALASRNAAVSRFLRLLINNSAEAGKPMTVAEMLERSEKLITAETGSDATQRAAVLAMLAGQYYTMNDNNKTEQLSHQALDLLGAAGDKNVRAAAACRHGLAIAGLGDDTAGRAEIRAVLDAGGIDTAATADCLEFDAYIAQNQNNVVEALHLSSVALAQLRTMPSRSPATESEFIATHARSLALADRYSEADRYFSDALLRRKAIGLDGDPDSVSLRNNWGIAVENSGNPRRALPIYDEALKVFAENNSKGQPPLYLLGNRARALEWMGRFEAAAQMNQSCVDTARARGQPKELAYCTFGLAHDARRSGKLDLSKHYQDEGRAVLQTLKDANGAYILAELNEEAYFALEEHRLADARRAFDAEIAALPAPMRPPSLALLGRAQVAMLEGRLADALQDAQRALDIGQQRLGGFPHSNRIALAWWMIAKIRRLQGDAAGARAAAQTAVENFSDTVDPALPEAQEAAALASA